MTGKKNVPRGREKKQGEKCDTTEAPQGNTQTDFCPENRVEGEDEKLFHLFQACFPAGDFTGIFICFVP